MNAERFAAWLLENGMDAALVTITGTTCPCMTSRDSDHPSYSAEWHAQNPGSTKCNGTGLISSTTTTTSIKATLSSFESAYTTGLGKKWLAEIGEISKEDLIMYGAVNASGALIDLSTKTDQYKNKITFNSKNYALREVMPILFGAETICYAARLVRTN